MLARPVCRYGSLQQSQPSPTCSRGYPQLGALYRLTRRQAGRPISTLWREDLHATSRQRSVQRFAAAANPASQPMAPPGAKINTPLPQCPVYQHIILRKSLAVRGADAQGSKGSHRQSPLVRGIQSPPSTSPIPAPEPWRRQSPSAGPVLQL